MSLEVEIIQHKAYVDVLVGGEFDLQETIDRFPLVLSACQLSGASKVLIDFRRLNGDIYAIHKMIYAQKIIDQVKNYARTGGKALQLAPNPEACRIE